MRKEFVRAIVVRDGKLLAMHRNKYGEEYYTLIGGAIEAGETKEEALTREVTEETTLRVIPESIRMVFIHDAGKAFGMQYIFTCDVEGDEVTVAENSEEAADNAIGMNIYTPVWLEIDDLPRVGFRSEIVATELYKALKEGFANSPKNI